MRKGRLEAFSDGVFAVIITRMVFNIKVPSSAALGALLQVLPVYLSYVLSFLYVGNCHTSVSVPAPTPRKCLTPRIAEVSKCRGKGIIDAAHFQIMHHLDLRARLSL